MQLNDIAAVCFDLGGTIIVDESRGRKTRLAEIIGCAPSAIDAPYKRHFLIRDWHESHALNALGVDLGALDLARHAGEISRETRIYPDVRAALASLSGLRLAVLSNCSSRDRDCFRALDIHNVFEFCVFSCEVGHAKPEREFFHHAEQMLNLPPERIVHVGDHPVGDIEAAAGLGWHAIHVRRKEGPYSGVLLCPRASASIPDLLALVSLIHDD
jgi:HAD superfamily hydrolase (TIGR01509 family)